MIRRSTLLWWAGTLAPLLMGAGCDSRDALVGEPVPNQAPDTEVTAGPPNLDRITFTVPFWWKGTDLDGEVVGFEWRISHNGRDGIVDAVDTLSAILPWRFTEATDSTFYVTADLDSFAADVADPDLEPGEYRFWQTHTFFVRAVDSKGARDPSPASVSFTATTLAPTVLVRVPTLRPSITCVASARVLTFGWDARDPDTETKEPAFARTLLLPAELPSGFCMTRSQFEATQPIRSDDPRWSEWIPYDAADGSGRTVTFARQDPGRRFLFAVQVKDEAGAVTPVFEWDRNVRYVETGENKFPVLRVSSSVTSAHDFVALGSSRTVEILEGQPVEFTWLADASDYAGVIDAYRYGWGIADPGDPDDPGWAVEWGIGPQWLRAGPLVFTQGSPSFVIRCRDNSGTITQAVFQLQVIPFLERSAQRNLLVVDDFPNGDTPSQITLELNWDATWRNYYQNRLLGFSGIDTIDAQREKTRLTFSTLSEYKAVVWFTGPSFDTFFQTNLAPPRGGGFRFNWLEVYQQRAGNLLLVGPGAAFNSSVERGTGGYIFLFPLIFDVPASGNLGFGTATTVDGVRYNAGTRRYPYTAMCLEALDITRPPTEQIFGETPRNLLRSADCDVMARAEVARQLLQEYPSAEGNLVDLVATTPRLTLEGEYRQTSEEFYNRNVTSRAVTINLRPCQTPMFVHRARREEGLSSDPNCPPDGSVKSSIDGVPVAIISRSYAPTKPLVGSEDVLWGFNPMTFEFSGVQRALLWIAQERWGLPVLR